MRYRPAAPARPPAQSRRLPTNPQAPRHRYRLACCAAPSRDEAASRLCAFGDRRPASADYCPGLHGRVPSAVGAVGGEAAHGVAGYAGQSSIAAPCAPGTKPGRGKSQAIEHNRALHKAGQSLRWASLDGLPLRALRVRVMVGYVSRPGPATAIPACFAASVYSGAARWVMLAKSPGRAGWVRRSFADVGKGIEYRGSEGKNVVTIVVTR